MVLETVCRYFQYSEKYLQASSQGLIVSSDNVGQLGSSEATTSITDGGAPANGTSPVDVSGGSAVVVPSLNSLGIVLCLVPTNDVSLCSW